MIVIYIGLEKKVGYLLNIEIRGINVYICLECG